MALTRPVPNTHPRVQVVRQQVPNGYTDTGLTLEGFLFLQVRHACVFDTHTRVSLMHADAWGRDYVR